MNILTSYLLNLIDTNKMQDYVKVLIHYDNVKKFYEEDEEESYEEVDMRKVYVAFDEDENKITMSDLISPRYSIIISVKYNVIIIKIDEEVYEYEIKEGTYLQDFVRVLLKELKP